MAALTITTTSLPGATQNQAYNATLQATGGNPPYTWSIASGLLPAGLSLAPSTGVISGTPNSVQTNNFTIQVKDAGGSQSFVTFSSTMSPASVTLAGLKFGRILHAISATTAAFSGSIQRFFRGTIFQPLASSMASFTGSVKSFIFSRFIKKFSATIGSFSGGVSKLFRGTVTVPLTAATKTMSGTLVEFHTGANKFLAILSASTQSFLGTLQQKAFGKRFVVLTANMASFSGAVIRQFVGHIFLNLSAQMAPFTGNIRTFFSHLNQFIQSLFASLTNAFSGFLVARRSFPVPIQVGSAVTVSSFGSTSSNNPSLIQATTGQLVFFSQPPPSLFPSGLPLPFGNQFPSRPDAWDALGRRVMGSELLIAPAGGYLFNNYIVVAVGDMSVPACSFNFVLNNNIFTSDGITITDTTRVLATLPSSIAVSAGVHLWSLICQPVTNRSSFGSSSLWTFTIDGVPITGSQSFLNVPELERLMASLGVQFSGPNVNGSNTFQMRMIQFELQQVIR